MSDNSSEQEPSIEEILSSIRQIISDEDDEAPQEVEEEEEVAVADPIRHEPDDVLDLTEDDLIDDEPEVIEEPVFEPEPEVFEEPEPEPDIEEAIEIEMRDAQNALDEIRNVKREEPAFAPEPEPAMVPPSDILSSGAQAAALGSLSKLANKMPINNSRTYEGGVTLEDIVREMLHPMLREWMDDNLPPMVERIVQKELEKLARRAFDE